MAKLKILVTGAGSGVGQGIMKSLRASELDLEVHSADISATNCALYVADGRWIIPKVEEKGALEKIIELLRNQKFSAVMIGSEFDLNFFSQNKEKIEKDSGCLVVASCENTVSISDDKFKTFQFLKEHGLAHAEAIAPSNCEEALLVASKWGYPMVLKTRTGTSNRHVHVISSEEELKKIYPTVPNPMCQELVDLPRTDLSNEYTCSVFRCANGDLLGPFTARRTLKAGSSWLIEVKEFPELEPLMKGIADKLDIMGSLNVQLMIGKKGPVPFEFNARFSGTTAVRAHFGFNEPDMLIRSYLLNEEISKPVIRKGMAFRYLEEVFLEDVDEASLDKFSGKGLVRQWF
ncbi:MAG: ATP-grasp domain-containing protein [Halobacteriovoraceae bacterium]|nr:ATP-grasp domain-containing protein [Halobacteriovoraceae bacterium]